MSGGENGGGAGRGYSPEKRKPTEAAGLFGQGGWMGLGVEPTGPAPARSDVGASSRGSGIKTPTTPAAPKPEKVYTGGAAAPPLTEDEARASGRTSTILTSGLGDMGTSPPSGSMGLLPVTGKKTRLGL